MERRIAWISGLDGFWAALGRAVAAQHRCQPNGLCTCGMDRQACPVTRHVRTLLRPGLSPPLVPPALARRVTAASATGRGRVSPSMAARPRAFHPVDRKGPR